MTDKPKDTHALPQATLLPPPTTMPPEKRPHVPEHHAAMSATLPLVAHASDIPTMPPPTLPPANTYKTMEFSTADGKVNVKINDSNMDGLHPARGIVLNAHDKGGDETLIARVTNGKTEPVVEKIHGASVPVPVTDPKLADAIRHAANEGIKGNYHAATHLLTEEAKHNAPDHSDKGADKGKGK